MVGAIIQLFRNIYIDFLDPRSRFAPLSDTAENGILKYTYYTYKKSLPFAFKLHN